MSDPAPVVGVLAASPAELTLMQQAAALWLHKARAQ